VQPVSTGQGERGARSQPGNLGACPCLRHGPRERSRGLDHVQTLKRMRSLCLVRRVSLAPRTRRSALQRNAAQRNPSHRHTILLTLKATRATKCGAAVECTGFATHRAEKGEKGLAVMPTYADPCCSWSIHIIPALNCPPRPQVRSPSKKR